jgi:hypothetical protein
MIEEEKTQEEIAEIHLISNNFKLGIAQKSVSRVPHMAATRALLHDIHGSYTIGSMAHLPFSQNGEASPRGAGAFARRPRYWPQHPALFS